MLIETIDFGGRKPDRAHPFDAGADVFAKETRRIYPGQTEKIPIGIGLKIPHGYAVVLKPRSGLSAEGLELIDGVLDSGYEGEVCAILTNNSKAVKTIEKDEKIGQLITLSIILTEFVDHIEGDDRGANGFGSTGRK